jgi:hypothetical protein
MGGPLWIVQDEEGSNIGLSHGTSRALTWTDWGNALKFSARIVEFWIGFRIRDLPDRKSATITIPAIRRNWIKLWKSITRKWEFLLTWLACYTEQHQLGTSLYAFKQCTIIERCIKRALECRYWKREGHGWGRWLSSYLNQVNALKFNSCSVSAVSIYAY